MRDRSTRGFQRLIPALAFLLWSGAACAQVAEISVAGGSSTFANSGEIGSLNPEPQPDGQDTVYLDSGWRIAVRFTINNWEFFGNEFGYAYNRTAVHYSGIYQDMAVHQGFYNFLVYATREGHWFRPFFTGGGHFSNFVPPGASVAAGQGDNQFGFNYGGGLKFRVAPMWAIRLDFREYLTGKPFDLPQQEGWLQHREIAGGIAFVF
jgi:opacity protein-like surface antigen